MLKHSFHSATMSNADGISVYIRQADGTRYAEYPNPYEKRHPNFYGSLRSRQVVALPDTPFEVIVEFHPNSSFTAQRESPS